MKQPIEHYENRSGGIGTMHIERLLTNEEMGTGVKMYAKVTIDKDSSLGYHTHVDDNETYYILQGKGLYDDNGTTYEVAPGDVLHTPNGFGHSITNIGDDELVFMALIIKT